MKKHSVITSTMLAAIGIEFPPKTHNIEKEAIISFARAIGDNNPRFSNEEISKPSCHHGIVAPPTFLRSLENVPPSLPFEIPYPNVLDGGSEWEYYLPVRPLDKITIIAKVVDLEEKRGSLGDMLLVKMESRFDNQNEEVVALQISTYIYYKKQT